MSKSALDNPIFADAAKARVWLENLLWADGRSCGYCGVVDESTPLANKTGFYQCNACRKQFTVQVGTVFERSHIPLNKWLLAAFLLSSSKKGVSAHQIHRMLGVTYKSAWFMCHRLREAMSPSNPGALGGEGKTIEADETYITPKKGNQRKIVALVERGGAVRSFAVKRVNGHTVSKALFMNADRKSKLMTDESSIYTGIGKHFADHQTVNHSEREYGRGEATTNTVEGVFSIFKRGMIGTYQHCGEQHLQRYLAEFDFRYSNRAALDIDDVQRTKIALKGITGKRLTYRRPNEAQNA